MADTARLARLAEDIKGWGRELGFQAIGIASPDVRAHARLVEDWVAAGYHGTMRFLETNQALRADPAALVPGTLRVISARLNYLPQDAQCAAALDDDHRAYISRYALGRDYHKVIRQRLKQLGDRIRHEMPEFEGRPFTDSAPILERPLAAAAGLGWVGKHTLVLHRDAGSLFFLGELLINLPLPIDSPVTAECGSCVACLTICPTGAITAPYELDARRCISYLTIEHDGPIPEGLRPLLGNRIYGCDDCQLICPWNRYAQHTTEDDFLPRHGLERASLLDLWSWDEGRFLKNTEGSAIRRIGYERWRRNLAVALGNARHDAAISEALTGALDTASPLVAEHIEWALGRHRDRDEWAPGEREARNKTARLTRAVIKGMPESA